MSYKKKSSSTRIDSVDIGSRTIDEKYCDCVIGASTGSPKYNPYAVCKSSVYIKQGIQSPGNIDCFPYYKFESYKPDKLKSYAKMIGLNIDNLEHDEIVDLLYSVKKYKSNHPELSIRQISILLSNKSTSRNSSYKYKSISPSKNSSYKYKSIPPTKNTSYKYKSISPTKNSSYKYKSISPSKNTSYKYKSISPGKNTSYK